MKLDFSDVKETKSSTVGTHTVTIKKAEEKVSQNGNNMIVLDLIDEEDGYVRDNVCTTGAAAFRAKQLFKALGIDEEEAAAMNACDLIGMTVDAEITTEEYEGQERAKVKKYLA